MCSSDAVFPALMQEMEQQLDELERSLPSPPPLSPELSCAADDLFASFMASPTPHPSLEQLIGSSASESAASVGAGLPSSPSSSLSLPSSPQSPSSSPPSSPVKRRYSKRKQSGSEAQPVKKSRAAQRETAAAPASPTPSSFDDGCSTADSELSGSTSSGGSTLDPVSAKRERRKAQNRSAAATSRHKKQRYVAEMEARIAQLIAEQQQLVTDVQTLRLQNAELKQQVQLKIRLPAVVKQEAAWAAGVEQQRVKVEPVDAAAAAAERQAEGEHVSLDHASSPQPPLSAAAAALGVAQWPRVEGGGASGASESSEADAVSDVYYESAALASPQWKTSHTASAWTLRSSSRSLSPSRTALTAAASSVLCLLLTLTTLSLSACRLSPPPFSTWTATCPSPRPRWRRSASGSTRSSPNSCTAACLSLSLPVLLPCR